MKTKLLYLLLFISSYSFAQNWSQVGATQFSNFASNVAMDFHPINGEPYIIFDELTNGGQAKVMRASGAGWVQVGSAISTQVSANHAIKFNPVTNEPWIAYRRVADNQLDVYSFDGTNWVARGTNLNYDFQNSKLQIQFNASGDARVAGRISSQKLRIIQFPGGVLSNSALEEVLINSSQYVSSQHYDFVNYNSYFITYAGTDNSSVIGKKAVGSGSGVSDFDMHTYSGGRTLRQVSGVLGKNLAATYRVNNSIKEILVYGPNLQTYFNTNKNIVKIRESVNNNKNYLMYSDSNDNLTFKIITNGGFVESTLPSIGLSTANSNFFVTMEMNPINGHMYVAYMDGGKVSVKVFNIVAPLTKFYVNTNVSGGNGSGDSWANAMSDLQSALGAAGPNTNEIWVAAGTYKAGITRNDVFSFNVDNLNVYGGFDGTESSISERDIANNPTILSGDLNNDDTGVGQNGFNRLDNTKRIVTIDGNNILFDGLTISDAHNESATSGQATAIYKNPTVTSFTLKNCNIIDNYAYTTGVFYARYDSGGSLVIENCKFDNNNARYASGMYILTGNNQTVTVDIINTLFTNNISKDRSSTYKGYTGSSAWIRANGTGSNLTTTITNCTFANNTDIGTQSGSQRGSLSLARRTDGSSTHNATINNCIFYHNEGAGGATTAAVNQGHVSMPNLTFVNNSISEDNFSNLTYLTNTNDSDPQFTDANNNDFTLQVGSPAIDSGDNSKVPSGITADLLFNQRIHNTTVDMGCYEFGAASTLSNQDFEIENNNLVIYPNPATSILHIKSNKTISKVFIYDLLGEKVLETQNTTINVLGLKCGMYLLKVQNESNTIVKRFIKR